MTDEEICNRLNVLLIRHSFSTGEMVKLENVRERVKCDLQDSAATLLHVLAAEIASKHGEVEKLRRDILEGRDRGKSKENGA